MRMTVRLLEELLAEQLEEQIEELLEEQLEEQLEELLEEQLEEHPWSALLLQVLVLKSRLKKVSTSPGDGVARVFLKSQAALFGSYRNALQMVPVSIYEIHA